MQIAFRRLFQRRMVVASAALALAMTSVCANAAEQKDDALRVTSACDIDRSRVTATKLFEFVERQFDEYRDVDPLEVEVLEEAWNDGRSPSFIHHAKFAIFEAAYRLKPSSKRALERLTTRSDAFKLPSGIKMGQSKSQVLHALGPPTAISTNSVLYEIGGEAIHDVIFIFKRGSLVEVSWAYGAGD